MPRTRYPITGSLMPLTKRMRRRLAEGPRYIDTSVDESIVDPNLAVYQDDAISGNSNPYVIPLPYYSASYNPMKSYYEQSAPSRTDVTDRAYRAVAQRKKKP